MNVISNLLQAAGNALQALGEKFELDDPNCDHEYSQSLIVAGSWIQAVGAVLSAL
ncbi:DUF6944 family repetitive protein [Fictibacillus sp. NPDC058756]|uniref:DUF6944 family repetitive protein n=1 Tax=Fictibacillus sp. NPDC058756 TaxID=3346625 RepID=UPI0036923100